MELAVADLLERGYNLLVQAIASILESTLFQADPLIAVKYAKLLSILIPLTAVYIIMVVASALRRLVGLVIAMGWLFIIFMMLLDRLGPPV